jgi:hypothetical protein
MSRLRKITATVSAVALLGAGGLSAAQAATTSKDSTTSSAARAHGKRPGGPMSRAQLAAIAKTLGVTSAQLKAALDASRPANPSGTRPDPGAEMATALASALNVDVADVKAILDANRPPRPAAGTKPSGARPARPDQSKLVAALASGLNIDAATVKAALDKIEAAHEAEHATREAAMYAAVAKELGLSTDAVKAAFEANRPAKKAS